MNKWLIGIISGVVALILGILLGTSILGVLGLIICVSSGAVYVLDKLDKK